MFKHGQTIRAAHCHPAFKEFVRKGKSTAQAAIIRWWRTGAGLSQLVPALSAKAGPADHPGCSREAHACLTAPVLTCPV